MSRTFRKKLCGTLKHKEKVLKVYLVSFHRPSLKKSTWMLLTELAWHLCEQTHAFWGFELSTLFPSLLTNVPSHASLVFKVSGPTATTCVRERDRENRRESPEGRLPPASLFFTVSTHSGPYWDLHPAEHWDLWGVEDWANWERKRPSGTISFTDERLSHHCLLLLVNLSLHH